MVATFSACSDDPATNLATPVLTAPTATDVQVGTEKEVEFTYVAAAGFASSAVTATGGTATVTTDGTAGATTGTVSVTFIAGTVAGAGSVTLTITDAEGDAGNSTAVLTVTTNPPNVVLNGVLDNISLTNDRIYELAGRVIVPTGKTITIQEGTILKGRTGNGSFASALIISRGGKIMAEGTAAKPIIFTSILDNIEVGQTMGSNLGKTDNEKWGGLIMLGKAKISAATGDTESSIEGLPADEAYGLYGGSDDADNSGILKYVSIRHGGSLIGEGNEINGLTLGGVGNGTTIDHLEVFATLDDGIEFFGGSVNVTNLLVYWQGDDGVDIDQNYSGTVTNFMVYQGDGVGTDEGLEIDGPENATYKTGKFLLKNGTIVSDGVAGSAADIKADAQGELNNIVWSGYATSANVKFEGEYSVGDCTDHANKIYTDALQNLIDDIFVVTSSKYGALTVYSKATGGVANCSSVPQADKDAAAAKATSNAGATGADKTQFSWTLASAKGLLN